MEGDGRKSKRTKREDEGGGGGRRNEPKRNKRICIKSVGNRINRYRCETEKIPGGFNTFQSFYDNNSQRRKRRRNMISAPYLVCHSIPRRT